MPTPITHVVSYEGRDPINSHVSLPIDMPNSHHDRKDEKFLEILKDLMDIHMLCPITDLVNNDDRIILKNNPYTMLFYIIEIIIVFLSKVKSDFTKLHVI